jgi:hypothetical protein
MAKKPGTNPKNEFIFFDVVYEDGSQRSNRRVPAELLGGLDKDEPARGFIIEQDREIAEKSGRPPLTIKSIRRAGAKTRSSRALTGAVVEDLKAPMRVRTLSRQALLASRSYSGK